MKELEQLISIRLVKEDDRAFIMATWLRGLYYGNPWFKEIEKDVFMHKYHDVITRVLLKPTTEVAIAALKDDEDTILGYSVTDNKTLHWVFVKEVWRKMGIAKAIIPHDIDTTTHLTIMGKKIKPKSLKFNPFLL